MVQAGLAGVDRYHEVVQLREEIFEQVNRIANFESQITYNQECINGMLGA
jgi:hypothetical protein